MIANDKRTIKRALARTKKLTNTAAKEIGAEAIKIREMAKAEFQELVGGARSTGQQQFKQLGRELVKLGHKLEKMGKAPANRRKARSAVQVAPR
ncbi:MAG TPA: hypothetical protein VFP52_05260 [Myxococcales bacterium]|nr:hypothetical protein [Myxococcales bacterium]HET9752343.1 hypothetical protein [Myxococcales bacterium]